jgi:undecaprenyl diphosphate synthase
MPKNNEIYQSIPKHVGLILDGNRRWAREHNLPIIEGHRQGAETFKDISQHAFRSGVKFLSAYIFSTENWSRKAEEVNYLMGLIIRAVEKYLDSYHKLGIKITILGDISGLEQKIQKAVKRTEDKTRDNKNATLALCLNYGGQDEIVAAVNQLLSKNKTGEVSKDLISQNLYHPEIPPLDLIIRSSGEKRLSGFMLWRSDYAELYFTDKYWPDFKEIDFDHALSDFANRKRRFGA